MLKNLFGKSKPASEKATTGLSTGIRTTILNVLGAKAIPSMPGAAQKAFRLATDPNAEARDFVEVIESDEALSAKVVKIANSVYFDRGKKSETIEDCVTVIGIEELRCLLNANTLADILPSRHPARHQIWVNDIATGLIARSISQRIAPEKQGISFLAGLMHDIGKLLLLQRASDQYGKVLETVTKGELSFKQAEEDVFAFNHCEVGQLIAEKWNFSPELTESIQLHHEPWTDFELAGESSSLVSIIKCADIISHALGLGHPKGYAKLKNRSADELEKVWAVLGVQEADRRSTLEGFQKLYELEHDLYLGKGI